MIMKDINLRKAIFYLQQSIRSEYPNDESLLNALSILSDYHCKVKNLDLHNVMASYSNSDEVFRFKKLTTFEELLFAKHYIKELKSEIAKLNTEKGIMKSEIDELKYRLKSENPTADKLHKYKEQIKSTREKSKKYQRMYERVNSELIMFKNGVL